MGSLVGDSTLTVVMVLTEIVTGAGHGVDVVDPSDGALLVRIQTNFTVQNFAWTGKDYKGFWLMGNSGVARVKWNLQGQELK